MKRLVTSVIVTLCIAGIAHADPAIRSLQQTLKTQGFYYGTVTGEQSAETTSAIRRYQIRNGLKVTGEINEETQRSLASTSSSLAMTSRQNSKPISQPDGGHRDIRLGPTANSTSSSLTQSDRAVEMRASYSASFYQSAPVRLNRRAIAAAQYQLVSRGYYRGRVDGKYGKETSFAIRAFQSSAGLPATGRLDMQTVDALGLPDGQFAYSAPASGSDEAWIPMSKFKHGKWKVKWKSYKRPWGIAEQQQANSDYRLDDYNED